MPMIPGIGNPANHSLSNLSTTQRVVVEVCRGDSLPWMLGLQRTYRTGTTTLDSARRASSACNQIIFEIQHAERVAWLAEARLKRDSAPECRCAYLLPFEHKLMVEPAE
eukprot:INCI2682.1.p2 GENE.INCI2682.1~~INCI2682.1.p2  ORF type:complete len:109 (-),score=8.56 INCI2682.1:538-864(-)